MSLMLALLCWLLLGLGALLLLALLLLGLVACVPLRLTLRWAPETLVPQRLELCWGGGALCIPVPLAGRKRTSKGQARWERRTARKAERKAHRGARERNGGRFARRLFGQRRFRRRAWRALRRTLARLHLDAGGLTVRVGLDDPAELGWLWGGLSPLAALLAARCRLPTLQPDFSGAGLRLEGALHLRLVPGAVLGGLIGFALHPRTLAAVWRAARQRRPRALPLRPEEGAA